MHIFMGVLAPHDRAFSLGGGAEGQFRSTEDRSLLEQRISRRREGVGAKCTVMGGQQVCNQACRPCNDGGVTVTTQ